MQELQIVLRNGHAFCVRNNDTSHTVSGEFQSFLDEFRLSKGVNADQIYSFVSPKLVVRMSEVVMASVVFLKKTEEQTAEDEKCRTFNATTLKVMN